VRAVYPKPVKLMKNTFLFPWLFALCCWNCAGQTNSQTVAVGLYSMSAPRLLQPEPEPGKSATPNAPADTESAALLLSPASSGKALSDMDSMTNSVPSPDQMSSVSGVSDFDLQMFYRLERAGYLTPAAPPSDNRFFRFVDNTFLPEVIHYRKVDVSCTLVTAIKRKNPLCLLNPLFFNLSW
jgi:hypothetical protein